MKKENKKHKDVKQKPTLQQKFFLVIIWAAIIIFSSFIALGAFRYFKTSGNPEALLNKYISENPSLVFNRLSFYKYLVRGTNKKTTETLDNLSVIHVHGFADFSFDLTHLKIVKTDILNRSIQLEFDNGKYFPVEVNVTFDSISEVESIEPSSLSEKDSSTIAKGAAVVTGSIGALLGSKLGSLIGGKDILMRLGSGAIGGTIGGAGLGGAGYLLTKNFVTKMDRESTTLGEKQELIETSKTLIALELMTSGDTLKEAQNIFDTTSIDTNKKAVEYWGKNTRAYYQNQLLNVVSSFFQNSGWEKVSITFTESNTPLFQSEDIKQGVVTK